MSSRREEWMRRRVFSFCAAVACLAALPARAVDQELINAAKKEGAVTWYTTLIIDQFARPFAQAFEAKYGIKVNYVRSTSNEVVLRAANEARANHMLVDVVDGNSYPGALRRENALLKWQPDAIRDMPAHYFDREGYWVATNQFVLTPGINTDLVPFDVRPRSYDDLLDPRWRGRMAWGSIPSVASAPGFIAIILDTMGEDKGMDYLRRLARQDIADLGVAAGRPVVDKLIAGEYAIGLQIFHHHTVISARQGAPVDWLPMQPALANLSIASVTNGPHPNAGKLMLDYMTSHEGQALLQQANYLPIDPGLKLLDERLRPDDRSLRVRWFLPDEIEREMPRWMGVLRELFR